jgi:hypothetical protein
MFLTGIGVGLNDLQFPQPFVFMDILPCCFLLNGHTITPLPNIKQRRFVWTEQSQQGINAAFVGAN